MSVGPRLLVIDDNPDDRMLAIRVLKRNLPGAEAVEVDDQHALDEALADPAYDAVITDYALGWTDGMAVLDAFKQRAPSIPVIMFTNTGSEEICAEGMKKGLFDYIIKRPEYYIRLPVAVQSGIELARTRAKLATSETELHARAAQLAEANQRKDEFLAMLAHELRNPLAPLRNAVSVLRASSSGPVLEQVRAMMDRQVTHMTRLVDDLLEVSRVTRGAIELRNETLDLSRLLRDVIEDRRALFTSAAVALTLEVPETPVRVCADATRLTQVLANLLENALKFTERGGSAHVVLRTGDSPRDAVILVRDTGIGITPDMLPHVFDVFSQADRSLERTRGGLGLGLALAKRLVDLHGGRLEAYSEGTGRGAEFRLHLPMSDELPALLEPAGEPRQGNTRLHVLIIEDNEDAALSLQMLLEMFGHDVSVAHTGDRGVSAALERVPDAIVCDIGLPGMDGYSVARALRHDAKTADVRLIALTGYGREEDRRAALDAGFDIHLAKPVDPQILLSQLEHAAMGR